MTAEHEVWVHRDEKGWVVVESTTLPGCFGEGPTRDLAMTRFRDVLNLYGKSFSTPAAAVASE